MAPTNDRHKKKVKNSLIALSSAAVLSVYGAGYMRTRAAAERFAEEPVRRRPVVPTVIRPAPPAAVAPLSVSASTPAASMPSMVANTPAAGAATEPAKPPQPAPAAIVSSAAVTPRAESQIAPTPSAAVVESMPPPSLASAAGTPIAVAALPTPEHPVALPPPPTPQYKDGTYTGWGTSRHGDIEATVVVAAGRILSARISQCWTRYSCSVIDPLPPQVPVRQSAEVDYVSGATQSTNAFYYAVIQALSKAK